MIAMRVNPWLSGIAAIMFGLTTNNFVLYEAGHVTKIDAVANGALILAGAILLFRKEYIWGLLVFTLGLSLNLISNHLQMTYYWAMILGLFVLIQSIRAIRLKETQHLLKVIGLFVVGALLAVGSSASKLWTTYEYSQETMRGKPILENKGEITSSSETEGLEWNYAMQWSNGFLDVVANYIPAVVGGSSAEPVKDSYELKRVLKSNGIDKFPYYWGDLPFTSGPAYYGALAMFLFVLSLFYLRNDIRWWALGAFVLITLISMGKHAEMLNRMFFEYFPIFSKFRAHNSAMSLLTLIVPVVGILGLSKLLSKEKFDQIDFRNLFIASGVFIAISLLYVLMGSSMMDFESAGDQRYIQSGLSAEWLKADRISMMRSDALRSLVFVLCGGGLLWLYMKGKLKSAWFLGVLGILAIVDILPVSKRYLQSEDFVSERNYKNQFNPRPVDEQIFKFEPKGRGFYRVLDQSINTFNSSATSYHHNTVGGYNAAKLQRIQDIIDQHISGGINMDVLNMLNTKYFINREQKMNVNAEALGNAWLVDEVRFADNANDEIDALSDFDPAKTAILHKEFQSAVDTDISSLGSIQLEQYRPDRLVYRANVPGKKALAVFSEIWYGPDKGWKAYVDGKEVDLYRANYLLRALNIPNGSHEIIMEFKPGSYRLGSIISMICSGLILLGLVAFILVKLRNKA